MNRRLVARHTLVRGDNMTVGSHRNDYNHWLGQIRSTPVRRVNPLHTLMQCLSRLSSSNERPVHVAIEISRTLELYGNKPEDRVYDLVYVAGTSIVLAGTCGVAVFDQDGERVWPAAPVFDQDGGRIWPTESDREMGRQGWPALPPEGPPHINGTQIGARVLLADLPLKEGQTVVLTTGNLRDHLGRDVLPVMLKSPQDDFLAWAEAVCFEGIDAGAIQVLEVV